jgi:tocopherol O-methyltransferase
MKIQSDEYSNKKIKDYYRYCEIQYRILLNLEQCLAMHMGYWDHTTHTLSEALSRLNQILAQLADIQAADSVLDAGCGVGGSSIYIADTYGCKVTGISLCENQIAQAEKYARARHRGPIPSFKTMDFTRTHFAAESFDVVWAIESVCYAREKLDFLKEAHRILKVGGRLVLADFFLHSKKNSLIEDLEEAWGGMCLVAPRVFEEKLQECKFSSISYSSVTNRIMPSVERLRDFGQMYKFPLNIGKDCEEAYNFRLQNHLSLKLQYECFASGAMEYGLFFAKK